jgi:2-amino-4-hydroxy-6-hydroxymethyldihydropteridine diphosphokinase
MGDSISILREAVSRLSDFLAFVRVSSLYITRPQDFLEQDDFYNLVVSGWTELSSREVLALTAAIEEQLGRNRSTGIPKGPRTIDIDIALFGSEVSKTDTLTIPHERMLVRQFVLIPLVELLPDSADSVTGKRYRDICNSLPDQGILKVGSLYGN